MLYIVHATGQCNLKCKYCGGSFNQKKVPWRIQYNYDYLERFIEGDPEAIVAFYGGEPLLNADFIAWVLDHVKAKHFVIQTNGTMPQKLPKEYWLKFDTILLSIDGKQELTDKYRGRGVYEKVISTARWLRTIGFSGDLIARMTVTEDTNIYSEVLHLLSLNLFSHVHWQLDVVWSNRWKNFQQWRDTSYLPGIKKLVNLWVQEMSRGRVLGIAPFKAIATKTFQDSYTAPPCGAGVNSLSILTDGRITVCPIAVEEKWAEVGSILRGTFNRGRTPRIAEPCTSCSYYEYCGGRCLYVYVERLWGEDGFREVCKATTGLINALLEVLPKIESSIEQGRVSMNDILYPPYNNTVEIIP